MTLLNKVNGESKINKIVPYPLVHCSRKKRNFLNKEK